MEKTAQVCKEISEQLKSLDLPIVADISPLGVWFDKRDFERDIKPFVEDFVQATLASIKELQDAYAAIEEEIAHENLEIRRLEHQKRQLKAKSTA